METPEQTIEQTVDAPVEQTEVVTQTTPEPLQEEVKVEEPKTEPLPAFQLPTEQPKDPFESLTIEQIAERYKDNQQDLLKAFGHDDFALGVLDYYKKTGNIAEYAEVKSVDYNKMPEDKIVERKLREQYATQGLSEEELTLLIEDEMAQRYKQDTDLYSERENQLGKNPHEGRCRRVSPDTHRPPATVQST
jgi:hypothetical protein